MPTAITADADAISQRRYYAAIDGIDDAYAMICHYAAITLFALIFADSRPTASRHFQMNSHFLCERRAAFSGFSMTAYG
jgi:hypothetical protein